MTNKQYCIAMGYDKNTWTIYSWQGKGQIRKERLTLDALEHFHKSPFICAVNWRIKDLKEIRKEYLEAIRK